MVILLNGISCEGYSPADLLQLPLTSEQRDALRHNWEKQSKLIEIKELLEVMLAEGCIKRCHYETIRAETSNETQTARLLTVLLKRSQADVAKFIDALHATGQCSFARFLSEKGQLCVILNQKIAKPFTSCLLLRERGQ